MPTLPSQTPAPARSDFVDQYNRAIQFQQIYAGALPLHAVNHMIGGIDPISPNGIGAVALTDPRLTDARVPLAHKTTHFTAGSDPLSPSDIGACSNTDPRLSDNRFPTAHKSTHAIGGTDALSPADIGAANLVHTHTTAAITDYFDKSMGIIQSGYNYEIVEVVAAGAAPAWGNPTITKFNRPGGVTNGFTYRFNAPATTGGNPRSWNDVCVIRSNFINPANYMLQSGIDREIVDYTKNFAFSLRVAGPFLAFGDFFFGFGYENPTISTVYNTGIPNLPDKGIGFKLTRGSGPQTWNVSVFWRNGSANPQTYSSTVSYPNANFINHFVGFWNATTNQLSLFSRGTSLSSIITAGPGVSMGTSLNNHVNWMAASCPMASQGQQTYDLQPPVFYWL